MRSRIDGLPTHTPLKGLERPRTGPGGGRSVLRRILVLTLFVLILGASPVSGEGQSPPDSTTFTGPRRVWLDERGEPVEFGTDEEIESFLSEARVVSMTTLSEGITGARRVVLERDKIRMRAIFRDVDRTKERVMPRTGRTLYFRDDCIFEMAAYRLSRLLGLYKVPPVVQRTIEGKPGTLQIWIEKGRSDKERKQAGLKPPDLDSFERQYQAIQFFDNLIYNDDRHRGNVVIDRDWNLWMIDHTQSFRTYEDLPFPSMIERCDRELWKSLRSLEESVVTRTFEAYLEPAQIQALLARRLELIEWIEELIDERGEESVFYQDN